MHELSMAHAVVRAVVEAVPGRRVTAVTLQVGVASGVVAQALVFAWDVAVAGTGLEGSRLDVVRVPLRVTCRDCGATTEIEDGVHVRCGNCTGRGVDVVGGRELELVSVEVEDDANELPSGERGRTRANR
ncbi:MAG TPA: hydrogenase maturation nickel metallochaperone HypA [Kineosporiaceae bacterium]